MKRPEIIEHSCDVCVVGGGLAGCMAAARAAELSDSVILVDKSKPERSGCAATGVDHIWGYFPEVQQAEGVSLEDLVEDHCTNFARGFINREMLHYIARTSLDRILDLERFGVKMRYADSTLPGKFRLQYQFHRCRNTLHFDGRDVMPILAKEIRRRGVDVAERVMINDLLLDDGQVTGAVGYGVRDGNIHLFRAKAVVMATGRPNRLYKPRSGLVFNTRMPPTLTGDGKAAMFRAGAEIINMELSVTPGFAFMCPNFVRGGGIPYGTYQPTGLGVNAAGEVIRPRNHDLVSDEQGWLGAGTPSGTGKTWLSELNAGRGPVYADLSWGSDADQEYVRWAMTHESGCSAFLHVLDRYGLDLRRHKIEIWPNEPEHSSGSACGPLVDRNCQTGIPGLFAAGDEAGGVPGSVVPGALTMGYLAAESAVAHGRQMASVPGGTGESATVETCRAIAARTDGEPWQEAQDTLQNIMSTYNLAVKSESMSQRGLEHLAYLENTMALTAASPHEMGRCLEVGNLIETAGMILRATIERKESRGAQLQRKDFPEMDNENFFCFLGQRLDGDRVVFSKHTP